MSEVQPDFSSERELSPEEIEALVVFLRQIPLFAELRTTDLEALVTIARSEFFAAGGELYHQSEGDNTLYIIQSGEVGLTHIDPQGAPNEVGARQAGAWLGESSLLLGEPHDVTVRALNDVAAITFSRTEFKELCDQTPGMFARLTPKEENSRKINAPHYGWQGEDEAVVIFVRQHKWALVRSMFVPFGILVGALIVTGLLSQIIPTLTGIMLIVAMLIPLLFAFYVLIDWSDDYYVVTNKRLVHVDELPIIRKRREEAPLSSITEIQFARHSILAHVLDFGDLRVETFGGGVAMRDIPHPNSVKEAIQREIERVKARARASERAAIRDELRQRIFARTVPAAEEESVESTAPPGEQPGPSIFQIIGGVLGYFWPRMREVQGDSIIWRKHWIVLLQTAKLPALGIIITIIAFYIWWNRSSLLNWFPDNLWWVWIVIGLGFFGWYLWLFEDWRNDQYIITSSRIIDIERRPFLMSETRREAALSKIQTTDLDIPSPSAQLFRYGNVSIRVPGAVIEFKFVKDPAGVQAEITKRIAEFNRRVALNDARGRHTELSDWFAAYNQIQHQPQRPEIKRPPVTPEEQADNGSP
jgi:uncharacterized membrane protein YdbT with pleckstrin-like domain